MPDNQLLKEDKSQLKKLLSTIGVSTASRWEIFGLVIVVSLQYLLSSGIQIAEVNHLSYIPIIGIAIYVGIISGYIPSPLYSRNGRWPKTYVRFQVVILILTVLRLRRPINASASDEIDPAVNLTAIDQEKQEKEDKDDDYNYDLEELANFTHWLGTSLHKLFYRGADGIDVFMEDFGDEISCFCSAVLVSILVQRMPWLNSWDASEKLSMPLVFLRNCILYTLISIYFIWEDYNEPEGDIFKYCSKQYGMSSAGWIAPDYSLAEMTYDFTEAWKTFHLSHLWLIRISHAILYPTILLTLTQRRLTSFLIWTMFNEIDIFHLLADMVHYVSGPELAEQRLEFQGEAKDCYINVPLFQTLFAYPMNFVYLATSLGDTPTTVEFED